MTTIETTRASVEISSDLGNKFKLSLFINEHGDVGLSGPNGVVLLTVCTEKIKPYVDDAVDVTEENVLGTRDIQESPTFSLKCCQMAKKFPMRGLPCNETP